MANKRVNLLTCYMLYQFDVADWFKNKRMTLLQNMIGKER
jgi:hypothetical protein